MDNDRFDGLARTLADARSRRGALRLLGSGALASLGFALTGAAGARKRKRKGKRKGKKQCAEGTTRCGKACVDLDTDVRHCGACKNECDPGQNCLFGKCVDTCSPICTAPEVCCVDDCVDLTSTAQHCGQCFKACAENEVCRFANCGCLGPRCPQAGSDATRCCPAADGACCDGGKCCPASEVCVEGGRCCPSASYLCPGTDVCCPVGLICVGFECHFPERAAGRRAVSAVRATPAR